MLSYTWNRGFFKWLVFLVIIGNVVIIIVFMSNRTKYFASDKYPTEYLFIPKNASFGSDQIIINGSKFVSKNLSKVSPNYHQNETLPARFAHKTKPRGFIDSDSQTLHNKSQLDKDLLAQLPSSMLFSSTSFTTTTDTSFDGVKIFGKIDSDSSYAVFATTTDSRDSLSFIFYLPLTVLAWKQIGLKSVVVIIGSSVIWDGDPLLSFVIREILNLDVVLIFLESRAQKDIMLSQVSRIFTGSILKLYFKSVDGVYLIATDADIWPIQRDIYLLPPGKSILSLNSDCCAPFKHRGRVYRMLPLSNIGMTVGHWYKLTTRFGSSPSSVDEILTFVTRQFGSAALGPTHKGETLGWYLDQMLVSILVAEWNDKNPHEVKYVARNTGLDRLDRSWWKPRMGIEDKIDAHLPNSGYEPEVWKQIVPLLRLIFKGHGQRFKYCQDYYDTFTKIILENGLP